MPSTLARCVLALFVCAMLLAGCSSGRGAPAASRTPVPSASAPSPTVAPVMTMASAGAATVTAAPQITAGSVCPEPYVTPIAPSPTPDLSSTPGTGTPTPIRIRRTDITPSLPAAAANASSTPLPPPLAIRAAPDLEQMLDDRLGDNADHYALVVQDLEDGRGVAINADHVFYAASLFKLEVLYEVFRQRDAGLLDFGERYVATDYYSGFDLGPHQIQPCSTSTIADLLSAMTSVSDNVAAVMLQDRAGSGRINGSMAALGLTDTSLAADGSLPATADDMARLVEAIERGRGLAPGSSAEMLELMTHEQSADRIPAELPSGTRVAHKTGNWDDATHDAGIVYGAHGTYVIVVMSDLGFGSEAAGTEADLAKIAFDYFEGIQG